MSEFIPLNPQAPVPAFNVATIPHEVRHGAIHGALSTREVGQSLILIARTTRCRCSPRSSSARRPSRSPTSSGARRTGTCVSTAPPKQLRQGRPRPLRR